MKVFITTAFTLALALSSTAAAGLRPMANPDLLPRDMSTMPEGMASLLARDAITEPAVIEKRANCFSACIASCDYCGSQGCLSNCQISCSICCSAAKNNCRKCATQYQCSQD